MTPTKPNCPAELNKKFNRGGNYLSGYYLKSIAFTLDQFAMDGDYFYEQTFSRNPSTFIKGRSNYGRNLFKINEVERLFFDERQKYWKEKKEGDFKYSIEGKPYLCFDKNWVFDTWNKSDDSPFGFSRTQLRLLYKQKKISKNQYEILYFFDPMFNSNDDIKLRESVYSMLGLTKEKITKLNAIIARCSELKYSFYRNLRDL